MTLNAADRRELKALKAGGTKLSARTWRRILTLEHLDAGMTVRAAAAAVGGDHREVGRVRRRYLERGHRTAGS